MTRKQRRLAWVVFGLLALGTAVGLVLLAARDSVVFFFSPSELAAKPVDSNRRLRIGGLVATGSVRQEGEVVHFIVTDMAQDIPVVFTGLLPDLFREGQGVVAEGKLGDNGVFRASEVLAKHDETYMPREVVEALKKAGQWQDGSVAPSPPGAKSPEAPR